MTSKDKPEGGICTHRNLKGVEKPSICMEKMATAEDKISNILYYLLPFKSGKYFVIRHLYFISVLLVDVPLFDSVVSMMSLCSNMFSLSTKLTSCFQMSVKADLESAGWFLSQEGIDQCSQGLTKPSVKDIIKQVPHSSEPSFTNMIIIC